MLLFAGRFEVKALCLRSCRIVARNLKISAKKMNYKMICLKTWLTKLFKLFKLDNKFFLSVFPIFFCYSKPCVAKSEENLQSSEYDGIILISHLPPGQQPAPFGAILADASKVQHFDQLSMLTYVLLLQNQMLNNFFLCTFRLMSL